MEVIYKVCCGLDVHKKNIIACLKKVESKKLENLEHEQRISKNCRIGWKQAIVK